MPIPDYVASLRRRVGHEHLWLPGATGIVLRRGQVADGDIPRVLLVRRSDNGRYAPVSGIVDPGELPADTVVREAWEETRVEIVVERLIDVRVVGPITYPNGDVSSYIDHAFRCRWVSGEPSIGDDEATEVGWWPTDALPDLADDHRRLIVMALAGETGRHLGQGWR